MFEHESEQVHYAIDNPGEIETVYIPEDLNNVVFQKEVPVKLKIKVGTPKLIDLTKGNNTVEETTSPDELIDEDPFVLDIDSVDLFWLLKWMNPILYRLC